MTVIEVQAIRPPQNARRPGHVVDANGAAFECWPEKLSKLQVGERYAVEVETREWQGRPIRKIVKAQPFTEASRRNRTNVSDLKTRSPSEPVSGNGSVAEQFSKNCSSSAQFSTAERTFVASIVAAFIAAGKVDLDRGQLEQAVTLARALWRCTLGGADGQH
jgi:hypothetical protein